MNKPIVIRGAAVIDPMGPSLSKAQITVDEGKILSVQEGSFDPVHEDALVIEADNLTVSPGFIDLHAHLRDPGFEDKETIATGTKAGIAGGFTTLCAMPNTNPATDSAAVVEFILQQARKAGNSRVYPIGCVTKGRYGIELAELRELFDSGVVAFSDDGTPVWDSHIMQMALLYSREFGIPVTDHCEDLQLNQGWVVHEGWVSSRLGLQGYPASGEESMVARNIALTELTGGQLHLAHLSTAGSVDLVRLAKARGLRVTAEVTPQHLTMSEEWVLGSETADHTQALTTGAYDSFAKVNPPLRTKKDAAALLDGLKDGTIDAIATDHAPHCQTDKEVTMQDAAVGFSVLETAFASLMDLVHKGYLDLETLIQRLTTGPVSVLGKQFVELASLNPGTPADLVIFDTNEQWIVDPYKFHSKGKNTPLQGKTVTGKVKLAMVDGKIVHNDIESGGFG